MFSWLKRKEETPYSLLMEEGKKYLKLANAAINHAHWALGHGFRASGKESANTAEEMQAKAFSFFKKAEELRRLDEPEIEAPTPVTDNATYRSK
jgi:hypothetical protein